MILGEIRVYTGVYEQGLDICDYFRNILPEVKLKIVHLNKSNFNKYEENSTISKLKVFKDFDILISFVSDVNEIPIFVIEYSTAVPVDDHIMQRFDFIYWSSIFEITSIKISPRKVNNQNFGGGSLLSEDDLVHACNNINGIYHHIEWNLIRDSDYVKVNSHRVSCPEYIKQLEDLFFKYIVVYRNSKNNSEFYRSILLEHREVINQVSDYSIPMFNQSSRINYLNNNIIEIKMNRFGHAMDPERGMLVFFYSINNKNIVAKFVMEKSSFTEIRGDNYKSLFDGCCNEEFINSLLIDYFNDNKTMSSEFALQLFILATNTRSLFRNSHTIENEVIIDDNELFDYLQNGSNVVKTLLLFTEGIRLYGRNDKLFTTIKWNSNIIDFFKSSLVNDVNFILPLYAIEQNKITEDIITYVTYELLAKLGFRALAVSYPGAQGDRAIISGNGIRNTREYIDIILVSNKENDNTILLQENKTILSQSFNDAEKLIKIKNDELKIKKIEELSKKTEVKSLRNARVYIGLGGLESLRIPSNVDYIVGIKMLSNEKFECSIYCSSKEALDYLVSISNIIEFKSILINLPERLYYVQ